MYKSTACLANKCKKKWTFGYHKIKEKKIEKLEHCYINQAYDLEAYSDNG